VEKQNQKIALTQMLFRSLGFSLKAQESPNAQNVSNAPVLERKCNLQKNLSVFKSK